TSDEIVDSSAEHFKPLALASEPEQFTSQARGKLEELVIAKISHILLYQHAKKQAGGNIDEALEKAAETEYRKFLLEFGGDHVKAEEKLKQSQGAMDKKSFMEAQKRAILIQSYLGTQSSADRPITYRELVKCYEDMKDEYFSVEAEITFRLIDIQPARLQVTDPNQDRNELAANLADRLIIRLRSGEDFGELAKQYSHGHRKVFGGLWPPVHPESLAAPYNLITAAVEEIEPGQITEPVVTQQHLFIIKLEAKQSSGYELFENVQEQVRRKIILDRRNEVFDKLDAKLKAEAKVERTDEFVDFCLEKIYQRGRQQS
ncbi:MAG: peptidylprolyl isomerase, partial [Candidatus Hydrogenedentota bacterium]